MTVVIDNALAIAVIKSVGNILTASVPSLVSFILARRLIKTKQVQKDLKVALSDIEYLLGVEEHHCREHNENHGESMRNRIRKSVTDEVGLRWSGKFSKSKIAVKLRGLSDATK